MGFYGNISNIGNTNMTFDKVYSSRKAMEDSISIDNIYAGRYVLVEYDFDYTRDSFTRFYIDGNGVCYSDSTCINELPVIQDHIYYRVDNNGNEIVYFCTETVPSTSISSLNSKLTLYYLSTNNVDENNQIKWFQDRYIKVDFQLVKNYQKEELYRKSDGVMICCEFDSDLTDNYEYYILNEDHFAINHNRDKTAYNGKTYDSTVWMKTYIDGQAKYVNIAELNTAVPTFEIYPQAPSDTAIAPFFNSDSTNLHYNLCMPTLWGFKAGDINFNKDALDPQIGKQNPKRAIEDPQDSISLTKEITNKNAIFYNAELEQQPNKGDTYTLNISLPSVGNAVSEVWDALYGSTGTRRDDVKNLTSIKGILKCYDSLQENKIPCVNDSKTEITGLDLGEIKLSGFTLTNVTGNIAQTDTLSQALSKLYNQVNNLDFTQQPTSGQIVQKVTQENGKIDVTYGSVGSAVLSDYTSEKNLITNTSTLNAALKALENRAATIDTKFTYNDQTLSLIDAINGLISDVNDLKTKINTTE